MTIHYLFALLALLLLLYDYVEATTCFDATFRTTQSNFDYMAVLRDTDCDLSNTRVTPLYMLGACCKRQENNFGPEPPECGPGDWNVMNASTETCQNIFAEGKRIHSQVTDAETGTPHVRPVQADQPFDRGHVCSDGIYGVIFVQTDCASLNASSVRLEQRPGGSDLCWQGHTLSRGALAGIVLGCIFAVTLLAGVPVTICWWRWRRQRKRTLQELQGDKLQDSGSLQIVKVADSVFLTKQTARSSSLYASTLLDQPGSQAYNIDLESQGSHGDIGCQKETQIGS